MKIVHVVRQFRPGVGGLENFVEQLALQQVSAGHQVSVVTLNRIFTGQPGGDLPRSETYRGMDITRVPFWGSRRYPIAFSVLNRIAGADIVHVHAVDFFLDYLALTRFFHKAPLILTTHGGFFHTDFGRMLKQIYFHTITRLALSRYAAVVTCSPSDTRIFKKLRRAGLTEIRNAVDIEKFANRADRYTKQIIYFGRLSSNKKIPRLLRWFDSVYRNDSEWRLMIAGVPYDVDPGDIRRQIDVLGLSRATDLHISPSDDALGDLIGKASVFTCASDYEGFGLAAVEAASAGLFLVLSDIEPFRNTVERLGHGLIVDFTDSSTFDQSAVALERALVVYRREVNDQDIAKSVEPFSWEVAAQDYEGVYRAALGQGLRRLGPVNVDVLSEQQAIDAICQAVSRGSPKLFSFANAHTINTAWGNAAFCRALEDATILNDGVGVDVASRLIYGKPFPENLNGTDLMPKVLAALEGGTRIFLIGSSDEIIRKAADVLHEHDPQLFIVGCHSGFFEEDREAEIIGMIKQAQAQVVLAGMGQPKQELWANRSLDRLGIPIICVGAFFDFAAGTVRRAPPLLRRLRLEWFYRLLQEPRRLAGRYLIGNILFFERIVRHYIKGHRI